MENSFGLLALARPSLWHMSGVQCFRFCLAVPLQGRGLTDLGEWDLPMDPVPLYLSGARFVRVAGARHLGGARLVRCHRALRVRKVGAVQPGRRRGRRLSKQPDRAPPVQAEAQA